MKITRFLPNNQYQAALSANAPTGANPFATMADLSAATTWAAVLSSGNISGGTSPVLSDGDTINAANGGGRLSLRDGADNIIALTNDSGVYGKAWFYGDNTTAQFGFGANYWSLTNATSAVLQSGEGSSSYLSFNNDKVGVFNDSSLAIDLSVFKLFDTTVAKTIGASPANKGLSINTGTVTHNIGIDNSVSIAGYTGTVKSNDTLYVNQIGFSTAAIELRLNTQTLTLSDKVQTFQDKSGTIALLSDIPAGGGGLSSVLAAGDTGSAGQDINLTGDGVITLSPSGPPSGILTISRNIADGRSIINAGVAAGSVLELRVGTPNGLLLNSPIFPGSGYSYRVGNNTLDATFVVPITVNRTYTFQDADGTVAFNSVENWTNATNVITTRGGYDANATTVDALADNLGTLISDLKAVGILS